MKHLSSRLTFIYKFIIPAIWTLITVGLTGFMLWDSHNPWTLVTLVMILPILIPLRLNWIMYDDYYVIISNGRRQWVYELNQVKAINESNGPLDPYFELEIREKNGEVRKVDFLPQDQFLYKVTGRYSGNLLEFEHKVMEAKS